MVCSRRARSASQIEPHRGGGDDVNVEVCEAEPAAAQMPSSRRRTMCRASSAA